MATKKIQIIGNLLEGVATKAELEQVISEITELSSELENKADKATTLEGYGITDAYPKASGEELADGVQDMAGRVSVLQVDLDTAEEKLAAIELAIESFTPVTPEEVNALFVGSAN